MSDPIHEKVQKLYDSRARADADLNRYQNDVTEAVNNANRRVRVERLVTSCEEAMTKAFAKNEQLLELAKKTNDPATVTADSENWLNVMSIQNDETLRSAREYIDQCPKTDNSSQISVKAATVKTKSSKASSSKASKTSSQRQRDLLIAKHKREEVERQNEAALRLAKQKQELELEQLQEENRKRLAEAHMVELELQEDLSEANEDANDEIRSRLSRTTDASETRRVSDWINNSPIVTTTQHETVTAETASLAISAANTTVLIPSQQPPVFVSQPTFAPGDPNETNVAVQLPTTTVPSMSLNHTPAKQTQTPPLTAQNLGNIGPLTSAVIVQQQVQPTTIPTQTGSFNAQVSPPQTTARMPIFTMPVNHILPNLSAWTFPNPTVTTAAIPTPIPPSTQRAVPTFMPFAHTATYAAPTVPVTTGGTVYFVPPASVTTPIVYSTAQPTTSLSPTAATFVPSGTSTTMQPSTTGFTIQDLALLLASTKKDHLPEWKLAQYNGDPIQRHEWFGQFKSAIDSAPLTDDVKLTYLKTLVTGKAKTAIAKFAHCGAMYRDALKTLERKFGQPQAVVTAYLDKLASFPPVKMHNSESIIRYSAIICSLVGDFRSLNYVQDL